jgi:Yip1 domain
MPAAAQSSTVAAIPAAAMAGGAAAPGAAAPGATAPGATAAGSATGTAPPWMQGLIERVKNIVLSPRSEWPVIAPEPTSIAQLYTGYVMPLAALAAVMSFIHMAIIGMRVPFAGVTRMPIGSGLGYAILSFGIDLMGLFLVGLIINGLAPTFGGSSDRRQALKVAAYSFTPAWLSSVLALSPILPTLLQWIALFYGIYVLYLGLPVLMRSPPDRAFGYTVTVVLCTLLLGMVFVVLSIGARHFGWGPGARDSTAAAQAAAETQGATAVGNIIGNALGTDDKGKAGLSAALSNLAKAGVQQPQASAPAAGDAGAQNSVSAVGGLMTALGGALGGSHRVDVVDFKTLTAMLPSSLPNMKRTTAQGESQGAVGVKTSSAKATYQSDGGASIHIEISDMSAVSGLIDMAGTLVQNTTSESDSGYERDKIIGGRSVHEKYDAKAKKSDISVMLAKRFEVDVGGEGVDMSAVEQTLGQVDLARLESMKDQGAQPQ